MEGEWISVKDRLPEENAGILFYCDDYIYIGWFVRIDKEGKSMFYEENNFIEVFYPTHWMPLPESPKQ